ncbi:MAG: glutamine--fructose-6-phosphate transaminase (isomerizing) [Candidatus Methylacidiphilales bacterium]
MCGIVAYTGHRDAQPLLLDGLSRLEYRGYDSAGTAVQCPDALRVQKKSGRLQELTRLIKNEPARSHTGISHTRWATHGEPNDQNAHPHLDQSGRLALVHNGVIDNYMHFRRQLEEKGHTFQSNTDSEVLSHLIGQYYDTSELQGTDRLVDGVKRALNDVEGTYGIAVIHHDHPGLIIGARRGSPLVIGIRDDEYFLASDATALLPYTQKVVYLKDFDLVRLNREGFEIENLGSGDNAYEIKELEFKPESIEKGEFPHFMLKEIFEQPTAIENAIRGRISREDHSAKLGGLNLTNNELRDISRITILASGTALHAGMVGEYMLESLAHIPAETDFGSEFRYRNIPIERNTLFFVVSQSGETADTLGALREAQRKGFKVLGICNNVGSTIARESDGGIYMHSGPEIGVAATKSFVSQVVILALLSLLLGRMRHVSGPEGQKIINALEALPGQVSEILKFSDSIREIAKKYSAARSMLYFGRGYNYPVALEAALKMKEISYIHAEGYPSSELKHGVIALVDRDTPSVFICPQDPLYEKNRNNLHEVKARSGPIIAVATCGDQEIHSVADDVIQVPQTIEMLQPVLNIIPLQLLSYHTACLLGCDVDKPRNLAKSVTVE